MKTPAAIVTASLMLLPAALGLSGAPAPAATAPEQAHRFIAALTKGDARAAVDMLAQFDVIPPEALDELARELPSVVRHRPTVVAHLQLSRAAVVVMHQRKEEQPGVRRATIDLDPFYFMRQDGEWRLMPRLADARVPGVTHDAALQREFDELKRWFKTSKASLASVVNRASAPKAAAPE